MLPRAITHAGVLFVLSIFLFPSAHAGWNDAGSGKDASGKRGDAEVLPSYGTFDAWLTPSDVDAYRLRQAHEGPACVRTSVETTVTGDMLMELASGDGDRRRLVQAFGPDGFTRLAIAAPSVTETRLLFENNAVEDDGAYQFTLAALDASRVGADTNTRDDAPAMTQQAVQIHDGCLGGTLGISSVADTRDTYAFDGVAGTVAVLSFATTEAAGAVMRLTSPAGDTLTTTQSGDLQVVELPSDGTYALSVSLPSLSIGSSTTYVGGLALGPPGSSPCRPYCFAEETSA